MKKISLVCCQLTLAKYIKSNKKNTSKKWKINFYFHIPQEAIETFVFLFYSIQKSNPKKKILSHPASIIQD